MNQEVKPTDTLIKGEEKNVLACHLQIFIE